MAERTDILVIGGGVIGVCSAYYLARRGRRVTVLERGEIASGCSYGNAGLIVPSHSVPLAAPGALRKGLRWMLDPESPFYIRPRASADLLAWLWRFGRAARRVRARRAIPVLAALGRESVVLYRELAATEGLSFGYREQGLLVVYRTERGLEEGIAEARLLEEAGIAAKILDGPATRALEPGLRPEVAGGVFYPGDAHLIPDLFVRGLARVAEGLGVRLAPATEVLGLRTRGRALSAVETTRGEFAAEEVVLAAGSWSPEIARALSLRLPIQPAKGYSVTCAAPTPRPEVPLLLGEARVAVTPMGGRLRFAGTLELAGLDLAVNRRRLEAIMRAAARYLVHADDLPRLELWRGLRPCTPDGLPIIGRPPGLDNLILATGHATIGVSLGPVTGRLVSRLAMHEEPGTDLALLAPGRFS